MSRHWTIEEVLDSVGTHAWMSDAGEGFEAAADRFWGRPLHALEPHEVATLIGVMQNPRPLDPSCHPERALRARTSVLEKLEASGLIDARAFARAVEAPLEVQPACTKPITRP